MREEIILLALIDEIELSSIAAFDSGNLLKGVKIIGNESEKTLKFVKSFNQQL